MAQTINSTNSNGLFGATALEFNTLNDAKFVSDVSGCKDPITVIVDTTSDGSNDHSLAFIGTDGKKAEVPLIKGAVNVIHITTHGFKKSDGMMDFEILGGSPATSGIKVALLKYVSVVNR